METKIASYQEPGVRIQLVGIETKEKIKYQVRKNRKIILTTEDLQRAKYRMANTIYSNLLQTKMQL